MNIKKTLLTTLVPLIISSTVFAETSETQLNLADINSNININKVATNILANKISNNNIKIQENKIATKNASNNLRQNKTDIIKNSNSINQTAEQYKNDMYDLRSSLEDISNKLDGSMAQAGAMSQLVMPYGTGNFNITAAAGHSGHADALAIGSGYRYNEHITVRAGGAYDTGSEHVTVAAGVGYEF